VLDTVGSVRPKVREELEALGAKLYVNERSDIDAPAKLPHGWMYPGTEGPSTFWWQLEETVTLHLYGRSLGEIQDLEDAVAFLDDWRGDTSGNCIAPHYLLASKSRLPEGENSWHTTILYTVVYGDHRKVIQVG
jgi:hypothetical protein